MHKSRAFQLFQNLAAWEVKHLQQFLESPFFNRRKDVIILLGFLIKEKEKRQPDFSRQAVFQKIYPNTIYDETKMYLLLSYLYKLMEQFLAYREVSKDKTLLTLYLAKAFRHLKRDDGFKRALRNGKKMLEKQPLRDDQYLRQVYDFEFEHYDYIGSRSRSTENNLQQLSDAFDLMYIAEKLKQFCFQVSHQAVFQKEYAVSMRQAVLGVLEEYPHYLESPAIGIYYFCYQAITTGEEKYFQELRELIKLYSEKFPTIEIRDIHLLAINFCIQQMNKGEEKYIHEGFEMYRAGLEGKYLLENNEISRFTFNNIVLLGIKLKQYEWVEKFIKKYKSQLPVVFRRSVSQYSLAGLRYEQKRYTEAMRLLATFESADHLMNLGAKLTLVKIYYELDEFDALDSLLEGMRIYIQRKKVMGYHRNYYLKNIRLAKKLMNLGSGKKAKTNLREKVNELQVGSMRDWFLEQLK